VKKYTSRGDLRKTEEPVRRQWQKAMPVETMSYDEQKGKLSKQKKTKEQKPEKPEKESKKDKKHKKDKDVDYDEGS